MLEAGLGGEPRPRLFGTATLGAVGLAALLLAASLAAPVSVPAPRAGVSSDPQGEGGAMGPTPTTFPWWGGLNYTGENVSGAAVFLANLTIPNAITDNAGYNYTVWVGAADSVCTWGAAGVDDSGGLWHFEFSFQPGGAMGPAPQAWPLSHLAPGDTYQLVLAVSPAGGGTFEAALYNASNGQVYSSTHAPVVFGSYADHASGLLAGPSTCWHRTVSLQANLTVLAAGGAGGSAPSRDLFLQDEGVALTAAPFTMVAVPNLWYPYYHGSPPGFSPEQGWSTSALLDLTSVHPAITASITTAPKLEIDAGSSVSVGIAATSHTENAPAAANVYIDAESQLEFVGYPTTDDLDTFATCATQNATQPSGLGVPGGSTDQLGDYGYTSTNTTPTLSAIYYAYDQNPANNDSGKPIDLRCFTAPLLGPGYLDIYALAYVQYDVIGGSPLLPDIDAYTGAPREILGMSAQVWNVTINRQPWVNLSASSPTVQVGLPAVFTAATTGGAPALSYDWFVDGAPASGPGCTATSTSCSLTWGAAGHHEVWVSVTDGLGVRNVSAHLNETVVPAIVPAIAPMTAEIAVGTPVALAATASGGTGHFAYAFFVNGTTTPKQSGPSGAFTFRSFSAADYQVWVVVNDSQGDLAVSPHANVTVVNGVAVALSPLTVATEVGDAPLTFTAAASGGSGTGYTYLWTALGLTPSGPCSTTCTYGVPTAGSYLVWAAATDSQGLRGVSAQANLTVYAPPAFVSISGPTVVDEGSNDTYLAVFSGGDAPFSYQWTLNGGIPLAYCDTSPSCSISLPAPGPVTLRVAELDALGGSASSPPVMVTEAVPLSLVLEPIASPQEVGLATILSALASNGYGADTFGFLTSASPLPFGVGSSASEGWTPTAAGMVQVWAEANDSTGFRVVSAHQNLTVVVALTTSVSPAPAATVGIGVSLNVSVDASGGVAPYLYAWGATGTAPAPTCTTYCPLSWTKTGSYQVWATVTDELGASVASAHTNVSVVRGALDSVRFVVEPAGAGTLVVNGSSTASGSDQMLAAGAVAMAATANGGYFFTGWSASPEANLSVASSDASTTLQVQGNGTVIAEFSGTQVYTLGVAVVPGGGGSLVVNGSTEQTGDSLDLRAGVYPIEASPGSGYRFLAWTTGGGASVAGNDPATLLGVGSDGNLTLELSSSSGVSGALFSVELTSSPSGVGASFVLAGTPYPSGASVDSPAGTYVLEVLVPSGYSFSGWSSSGGVAVASSSKASTEATISGNGTLTAKLTSTASTGFLGLPTTALDVLLLLVVAVVVVVIIGVARHRAHQRTHGPPSARPLPEPSQDEYPGT